MKSMNKKRKTVNIRMWSETRDRLKIASIRKGASIGRKITLMEYLEDVSKKDNKLDKQDIHRWNDNDACLHA